MRSREARRWLALELRDAWRSPTAPLLLALSSLLVGQAFREAVAGYAEASGGLGGAAALAQGLDPLDGVVLPAWGAYDLVAMLLFPFVAIRALAVPRRDGSWLLALQAPPSTVAHVANKVVALLTLWLAAALPGAATLALWRAVGGHLPGTALAGVFLAFTLRGLLTIAVGLLAAAIADGPSSAAILTLSFTVGTWALELAAEGRGGLWAALARLTPDRALHALSTGLVEAGTLLALGGFAAALLVTSALVLQPGRRFMVRVARALVPVLVLIPLVWGASRVTASWDLSEDRRHSLPAPIVVRLREAGGPLSVRVRLAPEDPRRRDLLETLAKLSRAVPHLDVVETRVGRTGLFAAPGSAYGVTTLAYQGRTWETRSTTEGVLLDGIFELMRLGPVPPSREDRPGRPLVTDAPGSALLFYLLLPLGALAVWRAVQARKES